MEEERWKRRKRGGWRRANGRRGGEGLEMVEEEKMEGAWRCGGGDATAAVVVVMLVVVVRGLQRGCN